jgi:hypothetical protein
MERIVQIDYIHPTIGNLVSTYVNVDYLSIVLEAMLNAGIIIQEIR